MIYNPPSVLTPMPSNNEASPGSNGRVKGGKTKKAKVESTNISAQLKVQKKASCQMSTFPGARYYLGKYLRLATK